jgi:hypothetical protein
MTDSAIDPLSMPCALAALGYLAADLHPVALHPAGWYDGRQTPRTGEEPIDHAWGPGRPTREELLAVYRQHPGAGVGLQLGIRIAREETTVRGRFETVDAAHAGIIDLAEYDPEQAEPTLRRICGRGGPPRTPGWTSKRCRH